MLSFLRSLYFILVLIFLIPFFGVNSSVRAQSRLGSQLPASALRCTSSVKGYLYSGIDNYLKIDSLLASESDNVMIRCNNGTVKEDTTNLFLIIPEKPGKLRLTLECTNRNDTIIVGYKNFHVLSVPNPLLTINGLPILPNSTFEKNNLLGSDSLGVFFSEDIIGSSNWLKITEFQLGYNYGGFYVSHKNPTNKLSSKTKDIISTLRPDHEISIWTTVESQGRIKKQLPIYRIQLY